MLHSFVLKQKRNLNGDIYKNSTSYSELKKMLEEIDRNSVLMVFGQGRIWANLDGDQFSFIFLKIGKMFFAADHKDKLGIMIDFLPGSILHTLVLEAKKNLQIFTPKNIAICCNYLAGMFGCNPPLIENFIISGCEQLVKNLSVYDVTSQELVGVVNNLVQLNLSAKTIDLRKIINKFTNTIILFMATPQELAKMANSIVQLNLIDANNNLELIINRFTQKEILDKSNTKDLSNMINVMIKLNDRVEVNNLIVIIKRFTQPTILEFANPADLTMAATAITKFNLVEQTADLINVVDKFNIDSILYSASTKHLVDIIQAIAAFHISMKIGNFGKILHRFTSLMSLNKVNYKEANIAASSVAEIVMDQDVNNLEKMIECGTMHLFGQTLSKKLKNHIV